MEKGNDAWIMSFSDLFINATGCVLLLMVLGIRGGHIAAKQPTNPDAMPVMITMSYSTRRPSLGDDAGGAGPVAVDLRLVEETGGTTKALPQSEFKCVDVSGLASRAKGPAFLKGDRRRGKVLLFDAAPNRTFQVQVRVELESPIHRSRGNINPYEQLVRSIEDAWKTFTDEPGRRDEALSNIRMASEHYLKFRDALDLFRTKWLEAEGRPRVPETVPGECFAEMWGERIKLSGDILQRAKSEKWSFPEAAFYDRFTKPSKPQIVEFETELTRVMREQQTDDGEDWRREWVSSQLQVLDPAYEFPLNLTLVAPGAKELMEKPHRLKRVFDAENDSHPWRKLASVRIDDRGNVAVEWDADLQPVEVSADSPVPEAASTRSPPVPMPASKWDVAFARQDGAAKDRLLPRIDLALEFLSKQAQPDGEIRSADTGNSHHNGPAVTGLALMAFLSRGHLVNQDGSQYKDLTRAAVEYLIKTLPTVSNSIGINCYHHGFAVIALAKAYPGLKRNGSPELAEKCRKALLAAVDAVLAAQGKASGGWGYNELKDDTSITCVMVKAISDARPILPERSAAIQSALGSAAALFTKAYRKDTGTFAYWASEPGPTEPFSYRQGGCMLARLLIESRNSGTTRPLYEPKALEQLVKWKPSADAILQDQFAHYGLFYAGHAMLHAEQKVATEWFEWSRRTFIDVGQKRSGDFGGSTYGTSMAVIVLALPLLHELERVSEGGR